MKEIYKDIVGYEGYYQISNLGNIKSVERTVKRNNSSDMVLIEKVLKSNSNGVGYDIINLRKEGKRKSYLIHRLVADAFIPNPEGLSQVNHLDKDTTNNKLNNLEWCTPKQNIKHSKDKPLYQYTLSGELVNEWVSSATACEVSGFTAPNISMVCSGKLKHHKGFRFSYFNYHN